VPPSKGRRRKLFLEVLKDGGDEQYKITLNAKDNNKSWEQIKLQLKKDIKPTDIKVGIKTLKTFRDGRILIEAGSEEEINSLSSAISAKCGEQLEIIKKHIQETKANNLQRSRRDQNRKDYYYYQLKTQKSR